MFSWIFTTTDRKNLHHTGENAALGANDKNRYSERRRHRSGEKTEEPDVATRPYCAFVVDCRSGDPVTGRKISDMTSPSPSSPAKRPRVGLFVTCLVDLFRPSVGFAAVKLMEDAGCDIEVPQAQTCCGQPAFNSGDRADARGIAEGVIKAFERYDYVVVPSGSCGGMIKLHYAELFEEGSPWRTRATALSTKTFELVSFLTDVLGVTTTGAAFAGSVTYHDSCSGLRELGISAQPRQLLGGVEGLTLTEMADSQVCCGFGGLFCVKYPDISNAIVEKKTEAIVASGAGTLLAGDMGCLMNMAGKLQRQGSAIEVRHVAEVLAGLTDAPSIGRAK